jgi:hypothetical protein
VKFNTLEIRDVVVHRVPARDDPLEPAPVLSEAPSPYDERVFSFFRQRMSGVMASRGLLVKPDGHRLASVAQAGVVLGAVREVVDDPAKLVPASQVIAQRLFDSQDGRNPAGILVVAHGEVDQQPCVGILKLEHEKGVQAEEVRNETGQLLFRVILHDDLLLTEKTAVFKGAVFRRASATDRSLLAEASDLQNRRELAGFFLTDFLGCRLVDDPQEATRKYFDAAEMFLNSTVTDPERHARYEGALLAQMNSSVPTVDPDRFARENLDATEFQPFLDHLKDAGANTKAFPKDTARIKSRIRRVAYGFESGLKLTGSPKAVDDHVAIETSRQGTKVTITDEISQMKGAP